MKGDQSQNYPKLPSFQECENEEKYWVKKENFVRQRVLIKSELKEMIDFEDYKPKINQLIMEEFDQLISLEGEAQNEGQKEAWEFYKDQFLKNKAIEDGFYFSNEMNYYLFILQKLPNQQNKKINKFIREVKEKLGQKEIENLSLIRQKFKNLMQMLKIQIQDPNKEVFQLIMLSEFQIRQFLNSKDFLTLQKDFKSKVFNNILLKCAKIKEDQEYSQCVRNQEAILQQQKNFVIKIREQMNKELKIELNSCIKELEKNDSESYLKCSFDIQDQYYSIQKKYFKLIYETTQEMMNK